MVVETVLFLAIWEFLFLFLFLQIPLVEKPFKTTPLHTGRLSSVIFYKIFETKTPWRDFYWDLTFNHKLQQFINKKAILSL